MENCEKETFIVNRMFPKAHAGFFSRTGLCGASLLTLSVVKVMAMLPS
jgi:hypothetical protein